MSKNNSKSLSSLRQKLRKYNKEFELDIAKFRENPDQAEDEEDEEKGNVNNVQLVLLSMLITDITF